MTKNFFRAVNQQDGRPYSPESIRRIKTGNTWGLEQSPTRCTLAALKLEWLWPIGSIVLLWIPITLWSYLSCCKLLMPMPVDLPSMWQAVLLSSVLNFFLFLYPLLHGFVVSLQTEHLFIPLMLGLAVWLALTYGMLSDVMWAKTWNVLTQLGLYSCTSDHCHENIIQLVHCSKMD